MVNNLASVLDVLAVLGSFVLGLLVLLLMVTIHEFGHYVSGKLLKFDILEFSIGMGPKLFSKKKKNGEIFSIRALPFGGFCAFAGEDDENQSPGAFNNQAPWKRLIVLFSGALMNFVSAILVCSIAFACFGETVTVVHSVSDFAPTQNHVLQQGDIIYEIDGKKVYTVDSLSFYTSDEMQIKVIRNGEIVTLNGVVTKDFVFSYVSSIGMEISDGQNVAKINDQITKIDGQYLAKANDFKTLLNMAGETCQLTVVTQQGNEFTVEVATADLLSKVTVQERVFHGMGITTTYQTYRFGFWETLGRVFGYCLEVAMFVLRTLGGLLTGAIGIDAVGGPITTISLTTQVASQGIQSIVTFFVLVSVNLGVFNLLPVPALDGCRMVFVLVEWIRGKPINRNIEGIINTIGFFVLVTLMVLIDLLKL